MKRLEPGTVRDCTHPVAQHQHGTATAYKRDRCRCDPCTAAQNVEDRRRRLNNHLGQPHRIDAGPVREHLAALNAAGLGQKRIAALAGVGASTIGKLMTRDRNRADGLPQQKVTPEVAEKILAVRAGMDHVSDGSLIDATGTLRRVHALHALGWSRRALSARLGVRHNTLAMIERQQRVSGTMARAVRDVYDELWDQAPPSGTQQERAAITLTLARAAEHGWLVPACWNDDELDDPAAVPASTEQEPATPVDRLDELLFLARAGVALPEAARRAGYRSWRIARNIAHRHGHPVAGLAERLELERAA